MTKPTAKQKSAQIAKAAADRMKKDQPSSEAPSPSNPAAKAGAAAAAQWKKADAAIRAFLGSKDEFKQYIPIFNQLSKTLESGIEGFNGLNDATKSFGATFLATGGMVALKSDIISNSIGKLVSITQENVFAFDEAATAMSKMTGQGNRYRDSILQIRNANREYGVTLEDASNAIGGIHNSMTMTSRLTNAQVEEVANLSSKWEKLGISHDTTGQSLDSLMKGMGFKLPKAIKEQGKLLSMAIRLNMPVAKMAENFETSLSQLGAWGKDAPRMFKKVQAAAHTLGVSLDDVLSTASKFDTFEGSAEAVGKLNAILQMDFLNPYEMMGLDEEQRIRKINEMLAMSGQSFEDLHGVQGKMMKQAIGDALGISDMNKLNKMFGQGLDVYDEGQDKIKGTKDDINDLEKSIKSTLSASGKLKVLGNDFAVAIQPVSKSINDVLDQFMSLDLHMKKNLGDWTTEINDKILPLINKLGFDWKEGEGFISTGIVTTRRLNNADERAIRAKPQNGSELPTENPPPSSEDFVGPPIENNIIVEVTVDNGEGMENLKDRTKVEIKQDNEDEAARKHGSAFGNLFRTGN